MSAGESPSRRGSSATAATASSIAVAAALVPTAPSTAGVATPPSPPTFCASRYINNKWRYASYIHMYMFTYVYI